MQKVYLNNDTLMFYVDDENIDIFKNSINTIEVLSNLYGHKIFYRSYYANLNKKVLFMTIQPLDISITFNLCSRDILQYFHFNYYTLEEANLPYEEKLNKLISYIK